ncbi:MAG: polyphosphate polymerase domain-containing protein [Anaerolineae bacterium]|nr:polyphosphate polymerase domain-containing protein [Anaerolineae bacterium]
MNDESILRYELKFVCARQWLAQARSWINLHRAGLRVAYPPRRVNSLYLDTLQLGHLRANLDGLGARRKVRWRWYGEDLSFAAQVYLELKERYGLVGAKKRTLLPCSLDMTRRWHDILSSVRLHAGNEWQGTLLTANQPVLLVCYRREYYVSSDGMVRVTLDFEQEAYAQQFGLRPNLRNRLPEFDLIVIEVKAERAHAARVQDIVADFPIPRSRHSKYVQGMLAAI